MTYPEGFSNWSDSDRDAYFAQSAKAYHAKKAKESVLSAWPDPRPIETKLPPVKPFDPDLLPDALRDYVLDVADRQQAPPDFGAVAALCGIAALAGNDVRIRPKGQDDWEVVPNLWGAIIGRPSAMKSPAMNAALAPVFHQEELGRKDWEDRKKDREVESTLHGIAGKDVAKEAMKARKAGDEDRARELLRQHMNGLDEDPTCPRLVVNDATVEKLGELLNQNKHGLLLIRDELPGFLSRMESEEHQSERAFYLESYNGDGAFTYDRIGRGTVHIERCTISIIGGVQPARIAPIVKGALGGRDDGLLQRFQLAVWPDDLLSWEWIDRRPNARAREKYEAAFQSVFIFARNLDRPCVLKFTPDAQEMFRLWMVELQTEARGRKLPSAVESHLLKMPKTVASLALLFEVIEGGRDAVGRISLGRALDFADYLKSHVGRIYAASATAAENGARLIMDRRKMLPDTFTARDVQRKAWAGLHDRDGVADAIDLLIEAGAIRPVTQSTGDSGGRPTTTHEWNPKLVKEG